MPGKSKKARKAKKTVKAVTRAWKPDAHENKYSEKIKTLEKEINILRQVSKITKKDFDLNDILDKFLEIVMEVTESKAGSLLLMDKVSDTLYFAVAKGEKAHKLGNYRLALGEGIAGWVAYSGKPLITPDVQKEPKFQKRISVEIEYKTRNIMCAPLKVEDDILGVVELINKAGNKSFTQIDLEILETFTPYISLIIKNAQLFLDVKKRVNRLEHLIEVTKFVNSTLELKKLLDSILQISTDTLNAEAGSIFLVDEEKNELVIAAATGEKKEKIKEIRIPVGVGVVGWVVREEKPVLIADAQKDPRFYRQADQKTEFLTRSIIAVPLKTKDRVTGVVEVLNKKNSELFNEEDMGLLQALANQAAVAIENAKLYENLRQFFLNTVKTLAAAIETKDIYTKGHSERVTEFSLLIAREMGFSDRELENVRLAAILHDIGKIGVDESILRKPAKLTNEEYAEVKKHPANGAKILESIPELNEIIPAMKHHHERFDGHGYPDGLSGKNIPYIARIISIADTFDAMSSDRPYRKGLPFDTCIEEIRRCAGTQFDPDITETAIKALEKHFKKKR
jgi:putative nucleotidyltransferase with HDIG domain